MKIKKFIDYFIGESKIKNNTLIDEFLQSVTPTKRIYYSKRDNCGPASIDFLDWIKYDKMMSGFKRVKGVFNSDIPVSGKLDFNEDLKSRFDKCGLDFNNPDDRRKFINDSPEDSRKLKRILHYWAISDNGEIYDPSGYNQFIKTGLSRDLNKSRYEPIKMWEWDTGKMIDVKFDTKDPWT